MIVTAFIPIDDHFRIIVAIAPEAVGVEISLPPSTAGTGAVPEYKQSNG